MLCQCKQAGLTTEEMKNARVRIAVKKQIRFLNLVANALGDDFLGFRLAQEFDLRELGLLYYVQASSKSLGEALRRLARYSGITNEGVHIRCFGHNGLVITFEYIGVARLEDRHQIEFFVTTLVRVCRQLSGRDLLPTSVKLFHRRTNVPPEFSTFFGCKVIFGQDIDEVSYPRAAECLTNVNADPYLNKLLVKYCTEALSRRRTLAKSWRSKVENAIIPLLPHGQARLAVISHQLGVSRRTLARRLESEGLTFAAILDALRFDLAKRYLQEIDMPISEVTWLLGYAETSAFNHAFKRWSGKTPNQVRSILSRASRSGQPHVDEAFPVQQRQDDHRARVYR
jgi:AraC-like DNA-binding protein